MKVRSCVMRNAECFLLNSFMDVYEPTKLVFMYTKSYNNVTI